MSQSDYSPVHLRAAWKQKTGEAHRLLHEHNQDAVLISRDQHLSIFGLADGQSGRTHSAEGGECILRRVAECIRANGLSECIRCTYPDELKYVIMRNIRRALNELKDKLQLDDVRELSSTLMMLAVDEHTGEYMVIHLGDGAVIGTRHDGTVRMISEPENGMTSRHTYLSTSDHALLHLRITKGKLNAYSRIVMVTDGASCVCSGSNITMRARRMMTQAGRDAFVNEVAGMALTDDASIIVMDVFPAAKSVCVQSGLI